jgi:hypothetical protein
LIADHRNRRILRNRGRIIPRCAGVIRLDLTNHRPMPTAVNAQVTDAITETAVMNIGSSPGSAMGALTQAISNALALASLNATHAQQQTFVIAESVTTTGSALILSIVSK